MDTKARLSANSEHDIRKRGRIMKIKIGEDGKLSVVIIFLNSGYLQKCESAGKRTFSNERRLEFGELEWR